VAPNGLMVRSRAALRSGATLAALHVPGFPALWLSGSAGTIAWSVSLVAISWTTLLVSNSPFAVGVTFAARLAPALLFGIPLGGVVDRFDRRRILVTVNLLGALALLGIAGLANIGGLGLVQIVVVSLGLGVLDTVRGTANQSYAFDLAGPTGATNAIALSNLGGQLFGSVGSIAGGIAIDSFGPALAFAIAAVAAAAAGSILAIGGRRGGRERPTPRLTPDAARSTTLILRNHLVAMIALVVIVGEILGFSSITLYPTFARDVLHVDAGGFGALSAARALGGVAGLLLLATVGFRGRGGVLLLTATAAFGVGLIAFSVSTIFIVSIVVLLFVGCAASCLDTLGQSLMQQSVGDHERGAAMGVWFFAIGFGPFGYLGLGAAASTVGAPLSLAVSGATLALIALGLATVGTLRRLR